MLREMIIMRTIYPSVFLLAVVTGLSACISAPASDPEFRNEPPAQTNRAGVSHSVQIDVYAPPQALLDWIINVPLEDVFVSHRSLPAVSGTDLITDFWGTPGARRRVRLQDGHQAVEELLSITPGRGFSYQLWGFTNEAGLLAAYAIGRFELDGAPDTTATRITWTYSFAPKSMVHRGPLALFVYTSWRGYMAAAIAKLAAEADAHFANHPPSQEVSS